MMTLKTTQAQNQAAATQTVNYFPRQMKEAEAAAILNVSREKLRHDRMLKIGPPVRRYGRSVRYDEKELLTYMEAQSTARATR